MAPPPTALARAASALWDADGERVEHVSTGDNSVYRIARDGVACFLRLAGPGHRSLATTLAEVELCDHLARSGARVSVAIPSRGGRAVETLRDGEREVLACVFSEAPGEHVTRGSPLWGEPFLRAWGRALGAQHRAAIDFAPRGPGRRWQWDGEDLVARARDRLPPADEGVAREHERLIARFAALPRREDGYGLVHADLGPQNFRYDPALGVSTFDFDNCCYHWFAADLAISLSTLRRAPKPVRDLERDWLLSGYGDLMPVPGELEAHLDELLQLRILYVYLDRLGRLGVATTEAQLREVAELRELVLARFRW